jgi:hypothetical protein
MQMTQLLYVSSYVDEYGFELPGFIKNIAVNYAARDLQGMTLFSNGNIMQLLEGRSSIVSEILHKLPHDAKQFGVIALLNRPIEAHCLSETSIGFSSHELRLIKKSPNNISVFKLQPAEVKKRLTPSPAKVLMMQFASDYG